MGGGGMFVGIYMFGGCGCGVGWRFEGKLIVWVWVVRLYGFGLNFFKMKENFINIDGICNYKLYIIFIKCL